MVQRYRVSQRVPAEGFAWRLPMYMTKPVFGIVFGDEERATITDVPDGLHFYSRKMAKYTKTARKSVPGHPLL